LLATIMQAECRRVVASPGAQGLPDHLVDRLAQQGGTIPRPLPSTRRIAGSTRHKASIAIAAPHLLDPGHRDISLTNGCS